MKSPLLEDWRVFQGDGSPHDRLTHLPPAPPWRFSSQGGKPVMPAGLSETWLNAEVARAAPFRPSPPMVQAVNTALYLRRPLLLTGKPGAGKSTLISKVAHELQLGPVLRWNISSRSTVRSGVYEYDAIGRLQAAVGQAPPIDDYLKLGPLGTALMSGAWPRPLLIDEIDKSDLDFANDLLNVIEEGHYTIAELRRLGTDAAVSIEDSLGNTVSIRGGELRSHQFPFVVMTSNGEREFPAPFLRRCIRLHIDAPNDDELKRIIRSHFDRYLAQFKGEDAPALTEETVTNLLKQFNAKIDNGEELATDQLLNAVFLTVASRGLPQPEFTVAQRDELVSQLILKGLGQTSA